MNKILSTLLVISLVLIGYDAINHLETVISWSLS